MLTIHLGMLKLHEMKILMENQFYAGIREADRIIGFIRDNSM
jgi:hypothetical protein